MIKKILPRLQKYRAKYQIFRPYLKKYLQENGFFAGYLSLIKIHIVGGLKSVYRLLVNAETNQSQSGLLNQIASVKDTDIYTYVIFAPDFQANSAGNYCLYKLCHDLRQKGFMAAMYGTQITPTHLDTPIITNEKMIKHLQKKNNTWVIYPEGITGNPLKFQNVARWVLNRPGLLGGDEIYDAKEKIFVYCNAFVPYVKNKIDGKLHMPTFDRSIFYPPKKDSIEIDRQLACYYVGKSTFKEGYFDVAETFEITKLSPAKKELGKLFRSAKVLYCFDNSTALIYEAIACGCPVRIIPDGTQTWEDYEKLEWGTTGIFWDKPVTVLTMDDVNDLLEKINNTEMEYNKQLDQFIEITMPKSLGAS